MLNLFNFNKVNLPVVGYPVNYPALNKDDFNTELARRWKEITAFPELKIQHHLTPQHLVAKFTIFKPRVVLCHCSSEGVDFKTLEKIKAGEFGYPKSSFIFFSTDGCHSDLGDFEGDFPTWELRPA
ncbi:MAG: hypothetical protein OXQ96_05300 [Alphaproteobacteria bacterium]|nr:hypothetical protein [Alphaproteobacteria bacterium]